MKRRKLRFPIIFGLLITAFTLYVMMDTFVITKVYYTVSDTETVTVIDEDRINAGNAGSAAEGSAVNSANEAVSGADDQSDDSSGTSSSDSENTIAADETSEGETSPDKALAGGSSTKSKPSGSSGSRKKKSLHSGSPHSSSDGTSGSSGSGSSEEQSGSVDSSESNTAGSSASNSTSNSADNSSSAGSAGTVTASDLSYEDDNIKITITEYREYDSTIYVADVQVSSPEYLKTALARNAYGKNVIAKTSETAEASNAIFAINGDYYGAQEKGYVIRNGVLYRNTSSGDQEDLVIYEDGTFAIINESEVTAEELLADGAVQVLSFGPALITDSEIAVTEDEEVGKAKASNPRTAIGVISDLHYVFVVSDGRSDESEGLTLYELAEFMDSLGVETAYNLDGGGSSTMYFNGEVINNPTTTGSGTKERSVSDIVCIGY